MKDSLYNTIISLSDKYKLVYNALSDKYLVLSSGTQGVDYGGLNLINNAVLSEKFKEIGAIVDDDVDEVQVLRDLIRLYDHNDESFQLHINPTLDCNCRCWYCYEEHSKGSRMSTETIQSVIRLIEKIIADKKSLRRFNLSFFGGEPLMCFSNVVKPLVNTFEDICKMHNIETSVHFTTNGALINEKMLEFFAEHKSSFQITLDGHRLFHDKVRHTVSGEGTYDKILANIKELLDRNNSVLLRINYTRDNIKSIPEILKDLDTIPTGVRSRISIDLQRVWQDLSKDREEEITSLITGYMHDFAKAGFRVTSHYVHDMVRNSCYGDKRNYLLVNYNGAVYRCTARDFNEQNRAGTLTDAGIVQWRDDALECRLAAKFAKPVCHTCRIAPLCGGGCCQQAIDHTNPDVCMYEYTDAMMDKIVTDRFEQKFLIHQ